MEKILLGTSDSFEQRLAVVKNGVIKDYLSLVPGHEDRKGSVYRGIVDVVEESLEACFVNIGCDKKAFLQFREIHESYLEPAENGNTTIAQRLKPGTPLLVKIVKDSRGDKGPLVSTHLDLLSGNLVLMPLSKDSGKNIHVSRNASSHNAERLKTQADQLNLPKGMKLIIRSNGVEKSIDELNWQLTSYLLPFWEKIQEVFRKLDKPALIYEDNNLVNICLREYLNNSIDEVLCDSPETFQDAKETIGIFMPNFLEKIKLLDEDSPLFDENIQAQLDSLLARRFELPSGGELVIDSTEALIAIDVNSRRSRSNKSIEQTAYLTNIEAANEIGRRLRLCNLSGLVVIDFIDMEEEKHRRAIEEQLRSSMREDKAQLAFGEISRFGLLEMTRQNIGRALHESHSDLCPNCRGVGRIQKVGTFARQMLEKIRSTCSARKQVGRIVMQLPEDPATLMLNEQRQQVQEIENDYGIELIILPDTNLHIPDHRMRVERERQGANGKASYEQAPQTNIENESYLGKNLSKRKVVAPAITSFKAKHHSIDGATQQDAGENGIFQRLIKMLTGSNGNVTEAAGNSKGSQRKNRETKPGSSGRKGKQASANSSQTRRQSSNSSSSNQRRSRRGGRKNSASRNRQAEQKRQQGQSGDEAATKPEHTAPKDTAPAKQQQSGSTEANSVEDSTKQSMPSSVAKEQHASKPQAPKPGNGEGSDPASSTSSGQSEASKEQKAPLNVHKKIATDTQEKTLKAQPQQAAPTTAESNPAQSQDPEEKPETKLRKRDPGNTVRSGSSSL